MVDSLANSQRWHKLSFLELRLNAFGKKNFLFKGNMPNLGNVSDEKVGVWVPQNQSKDFMPQNNYKFHFPTLPSLYVYNSNNTVQALQCIWVGGSFSKIVGQGEKGMRMGVL